MWDKKESEQSFKNQITLYTIKKYLNFGQENNLCSYNHEECMKARKKQRINEGRFAHSVMVRCDQTGEIFSNMQAANEKYHCNVPSYFYQNRGYAGVLPDGTKLTWTKVLKGGFLNEV